MLRRPLVIVNGQTKELPYGDTLAAVIDRTGLTTEYHMAVGDVVLLSFNSITELLLYLTTAADEFYELHITVTVASTTATPVTLSPNNVSNTGIFQNLNGSTSDPSAFSLSNGTMYDISIKINTTTAAKTCSVTGICWNGSPNITTINCYSLWDNATIWSSMGKLTFPNSQSGKIIIRRII